MRNGAKAFVSEAASLKIVVKVIDVSVIALLGKLGFIASSSEEEKTLSLVVRDEKSKIDIMKKLRDDGFCFAIGPGWCPSDVFEFLRDQRLVSGAYRKIIWYGPGNSKVIEDC